MGQTKHDKFVSLSQSEVLYITRRGKCGYLFTPYILRNNNSEEHRLMCKENDATFWQDHLSLSEASCIL